MQSTDENTKKDAALAIEYGKMNVQELRIQQEQLNSRITEEMAEIHNELDELLNINEGIVKYEQYILSYGNLLLIRPCKYSIVDIISMFPSIDEVYIRAFQNSSHSQFLFNLLIEGERNIANNNLISSKKRQLVKEISYQPGYKIQEDTLILQINLNQKELFLLNSDTPTIREFLTNIEILDENIQKMQNHLDECSIKRKQILIT